MFLRKVQNAFNKSALSYEAAGQIQRGIAYTLVQETFHGVAGKDIKQVMDIGTGTGFVIEACLKYLPQAIYTANDLSGNMIKIAKEKFFDFQNIHYLIGDARTTHFKPSDLTLSSMSLQWFPDVKSILSKLYHKTKIISFSTIVENNFSEWHAILREFGMVPPNFHTQKELEEICLALNPSRYKFFNQSYTINFNNALEMVTYLKKLGANVNNNDNGYLVKNLLKHYKKAINTHYEVFFSILEK